MTRTQSIVLDMDETLVHAFTDLTPEEEARVRALLHVKLRLYDISVRDIQVPRGSGVVDDMLVVERPYVLPFLRFCSRRFERVYIWSAGQTDYVNRNIRHLAREADIHNVYTFPDCAVDDATSLIHKPLAKAGLDPATTFIVDDRATAFLSDPQNGILIPRYRPTPAQLAAEANPARITADLCLVRLMSYLARRDVRDAADVRLLHKGIFADPGVSHPCDTTVVDVPGDGDCLFSAVVRGITADAIVAHATEFHLGAFALRCPQYAALLRKFVPGPRLSAMGLRCAVAALFLGDPERTRAYLEHSAEVRATPAVADQVRWMEPFWLGDHYSAPAFQRALLDRARYWGDQAALHILADLTAMRLLVWDPDRTLIYQTPWRATTWLGDIALLLTDGHYQLITAPQSAEGGRKRARPG